MKEEHIEEPLGEQPVHHEWMISEKMVEKIAKTVCRGFVKELWFWFAIIAVTIAWVISIMNTFDLMTDDSDKDGFNRSGLRVHTDYKTGIQYLSDGHGGLVRREQK